MISLQSKAVRPPSNSPVCRIKSLYICPRDRMAQLHSQAFGSLFVPFCVSYGYSEGILTRLRTQE
jgi:hypothetical protein